MDNFNRHMYSFTGHASIVKGKVLRRSSGVANGEDNKAQYHAQRETRSKSRHSYERKIEMTKRKVDLTFSPWVRP